MGDASAWEQSKRKTVVQHTNVFMNTEPDVVGWRSTFLLKRKGIEAVKLRESYNIKHELLAEHRARCYWLEK